MCIQPARQPTSGSLRLPCKAADGSSVRTYVVLTLPSGINPVRTVRDEEQARASML